MIEHCFVIYRQEKRARATRQPMSHEGARVWIEDRHFLRWRALGQFSHILDTCNRLVGFLFSFLDNPPNAPQWWRWVESCENCSYKDDELEVFLGEQARSDPYSDCACIIGGDIYHDGEGEFVIVIPDMNGWISSSRNWGKMWDTIGFDSEGPHASRLSQG